MCACVEPRLFREARSMARLNKRRRQLKKAREAKSKVADPYGDHVCGECR